MHRLALDFGSGLSESSQRLASAACLGMPRSLKRAFAKYRSDRCFKATSRRRIGTGSLPQE